MEEATQKLHTELQKALGEENHAHLKKRLASSEPVEILHAFFHFNVSDWLVLLSLMDEEKAAEVVSSLDQPSQKALAAVMPSPDLQGLVGVMEPDDAADIMGVMPLPKAEELLEALPEEKREELANLLLFHEDTAGGLMDPDVVKVKADQTVAEALESIRAYVEKVRMDEFFTLFVTGANDLLVGAVPTWKMLIASPEQKISEIMIADVLSVRTDVDQEEIIRLVRDHDLVTVPVVNEVGRLVGRVTVDDVVDVIKEEFHEDMGHISGTRAEEVRELSLLNTIRGRAPWLLIALAGEMVSAMIMRDQQGFLISIPQLAFFIPLIMAMGGNASMQSSSLVIRGLATGEVQFSHFWRRLSREVTVALSIGMLIALVVILGGVFFSGNSRLAIALGLSTMTAILLATTMGAAMPLLLHRAGVDPALATGPFLTTINDILGIIVYLGIAYLIL